MIDVIGIVQKFYDGRGYPINVKEISEMLFEGLGLHMWWDDWLSGRSIKIFMPGYSPTSVWKHKQPLPSRNDAAPKLESHYTFPGPKRYGAPNITKDGGVTFAISTRGGPHPFPDWNPTRGHRGGGVPF